MTELAGLLPEYPIVMEFRGVGRILGPQIMAEVGDVLRFEKKESLVCFAGLEAPPYESEMFYALKRKNLLFALPVLRRRRMNPVNLNLITELFPKKVHLI